VSLDARPFEEIGDVARDELLPCGLTQGAMQNGVDVLGCALTSPGVDHVGVELFEVARLQANETVAPDLPVGRGPSPGSDRPSTCMAGRAAHAETLVATDFFSVDTVFFKRLYVLMFVHIGLGGAEVHPYSAKSPPADRQRGRLRPGEDALRPLACSPTHTVRLGRAHVHASYHGTNNARPKLWVNRLNPRNAGVASLGMPSVSVSTACTAM
jgi:hypothetical protein